MIQEEGEARVEKEIQKVREIVEQDYQFKKAQLAEGYKEKEKKLRTEFLNDKKRFIERQELEFETLKKMQLSQDRQRAHAQTV